MALQDPTSESSAHRRQSLPLLPGAPPLDSSTPSTSPDPSSSSPNNPNPANPSPSGPLQPSPSPSLDPSNPTPTTPNAASPSPSPSLPSGTPTNGASPVSTPTPASPKSPAAQSPGPSPSPTSPASPTSVISGGTNSPTPVASPQSGSNTTPTPTAALPTHPATNDPSLNTITSVVSESNAHPFATPHRTVPTSTPAAQADNSGGLSGGAITGIAVVAGIIGFILLFWVGVQMLQSKRRRREEAEMQEIDFYPSGGGSVNGGMAYPRATGSLDRQPSASNSFNYNKSGPPAHFTDPSYSEAIRDDREYIEPRANSEYESGLQRQATLGGSSAYSRGYYNNPVPVPPAPYPNYAPYSHQFGMQPPPQPVYEQNPYEYPLGRAPTGEYHHGHAPSNPPSSIEYQR